MSERKALNKYYPPDYNPIEAEKLLRKQSKKLKSKQKNSVTIRLMTPFSIKCLKCFEFIPQSRKFNGKKELLPDRYLDNIKIYRLTIRCPRCANIISFRTDPKTSDYVMETGGERNFVKKEEENAKAKEETIDETLERLARQQDDEAKEQEKLSNKSRVIDGDDSTNKIEVLEERLTKLQRQHEDDEELERLKNINIRRLRNEEKLMDHDNDYGNDSLSARNVDQDIMIDQHIEELFSNRDTSPKTNGIKANDIGVNVLDNKSNTVPSPKRMLNIRITKNRKNTKKNPLGIKIKRINNSKG